MQEVNYVITNIIFIYKLTYWTYQVVVLAREIHLLSWSGLISKCQKNIVTAGIVSRSLAFNRSQEHIHHPLSRLPKSTILHPSSLLATYRLIHMYVSRGKPALLRSTCSITHKTSHRPCVTILVYILLLWYQTVPCHRHWLPGHNMQWHLMEVEPWWLDWPIWMCAW